MSGCQWLAVIAFYYLFFTAAFFKRIFIGPFTSTEKLVFVQLVLWIGAATCIFIAQH